MENMGNMGGHPPHLIKMRKPREDRIKDLAKFDLCEEFADCFCLTVEYVWREFVDPNFSEYEDVERILSAFPDP